MDIVDSQVHVFFNFGLEQALTAMDALGIRSVIVDEVWGIDDGLTTPAAVLPDGFRRSISPLAEAASARHPDRFAYLQRVDRQDPGLHGWVDVLAGMPGCRALRVNIHPRAERAAMHEGGYDDLLAQAASHQLPVCVFGRELGDALPAALSRCSQATVVIDHCGWPRSAQEWESLLSLARFPNVVLKWSHAHHAFGPCPFPFEPLQDHLLQAVGAFGSQRIVWASDVTHDSSGSTWSDLMHYVRDSNRLDSEQKAAILGGNARRIFRWPAG